MSTKNLLECMICEKVMNVPVVLPCQCFMCMEHIDRFEKNGDNIQCGLCKETFTRQFLRVNKRFKASIDNEEYLTDIEKNLKIESKTILSNLQRTIEALNPIESSIKSLNTAHFENMRKNIDEQTNNLKNQIDSYSCLLKNRSSQLEEEYSKKILIAGKQVKSLRNDYDKKSDFLEELFRTPNLSVETVNSNKQELNNILHQSELLKRNLDKMCTDINSVVFEANTSFCQELFGSLNSKLNSNLTRFENENAQETLLPANIDEPNLDPIRVSSTTNLEPATVNSTLSPHVEFNMNDYNSGEETSETSNSNDEVEKCYDILSNYKKNVETTKDTFLSLTRPYNFQGKKMNSGFIIIDLNTFKTIKKSSFDCKAWCAHVFQGDKIFIGTTGGLIKLVSLNDTKMCYRSFCGKSKQRVNCLKVLPEKNKNRVLLASGHQDCVIKIWDIDTASCLFILEGHMSWINCIECLPNGNIISGSNDGTMKIWNLEDGSLIKTLTRKTSKISNKSQSIYCLKVLDDQRIACGSGDGFIEIFNFETNECLSKTCAHLKHIWQISLTPSGELISSSGDKTIKSWLIENNEIKFIQVVGEHRNEVFGFLVREDGVLVSGSWDGFKKYDMYDGKCIETFNSNYASDQIQFVDYF